MKLSTNPWSEQGSALVDLIGFGILLQIPILMFATIGIQSQQQSFAVESIARHALRAHSLWPVNESTQQVVSEIAKDFGITPERLQWRIICSPNPNCLAANTTARIEVRMGDLIAYSSQRF